MKRWFTIKEASEYLGTSRDFVRDIIVDGLSYYRVRHTVFVEKDELDSYIIKHKIV